MQRKIMSVAPVVFAAVGWIWLLVTGGICPLPLGAVPAAIMLLMQFSVPLGIAALAAFVGLLLIFILCLKRGTRNSRKTAAAIILLDVALSILFTLASMWMLVGILLDLLMILLLFRRKHPGREGEQALE